MTRSTAKEVDSQASLVDQTLQSGIQAARKREKALARRLLLKATELDPAREDAWLWLSGVAESPQEAQAYLQTVLALNPDNRQAQEGLRWLQRQEQAAPSVLLCPQCGSSIPLDGVECPNCGHVGEKEANDVESGIKSTASLALDEPATSPVTASGELSPSFVLSVEQAEAVDACLAKMAYESEAKSIVLADVTGQLISELGQMSGMNTQVLSALAAGELAATHEMARLVGEKARFKLLLHEGEKQSVYLSDVGEQLILVIVFNNDTPIGLVRMVLKQAVEELAPLLEQSRQTQDVVQANEALGSDFAQLLENELDASLDF